MELMAKSWRSPDTVEFLKFRKKSDSSLDSEMMGGMVNEGFEEDFVDGNESVSQTKEDGTQETHFNGSWNKEVNKEVENSIAKAKAEKEAEAKEADEEEKIEYGEESKIDFGEEDSEEDEEEEQVELELKKVEHFDLSHIMDMERWSNLPIGLEYSGDSRESSVI